MAHIMESVKTILRRDSNTNLVVIPGGLTSLLRPLDVWLNKPSMGKLHVKWMKWMSEGEKTFTACCK